jgi:nucleotidyltransferase substrate binding protein (TIGR01987 family)
MLDPKQGVSMTWIMRRPPFAFKKTAGPVFATGDTATRHVLPLFGCKGGVVVSSLDLSALRSAVASLDAGLRVTGDSAWFDAQSQAVRDTLIAGVVPNFEFVYELSVRMLRRQLERASDSPDEIDKASFRDMVRTAGEKGLIADVEAWFRHRTMRNISAHTYDHEKAKAVYHGARALLNDARVLLDALEACNG